MAERINPAHGPAPDFGAIGEAAKARPSAIVQIGTGSVAIGRETVDARKYADAHLFDRMLGRAQISESQHTASYEALRRYTAARMEPRVTGSYAPRGWLRGQCCSELDDELPEPLVGWRHLLADLPAREAVVLEDACRGRHPGIEGLPRLQEALDRLGRRWGVRI